MNGRGLAIATLVTASTWAAEPEAPDGARFARGMTVSFPGAQSLHFRLLSKPLPDRGQGGPVTELRLGPPLDLWVLGRDGNRLAVERAKLVSPSRKVIAPKALGHWRVDRPELGYYDLTVAPAGKEWRLWSAFHSFMVRLDKPVTLQVGERPGAVFLHGTGKRLELVEPGPTVIRVDKKVHWAAFLPWDLFEPSQPHVEIRGRTRIEPGQPLSLTAAVIDPDDDVKRITWRLPDGESVEGKQLTREVRHFTTHTVRVTVEDRAGNRAEAQAQIVPPAVHEARVSGLMLIQAEDFAAEGEGKVEVTDRGSNVGQMITKWHQDPGHWIEWTLPIRQAGRYTLYARYGTASRDTCRELTIDEQAPTEAYQRVAFARTGGYGRSPVDWPTTRLGPPVRLSAGKHTLRMTNLGGGLALDYLAVVPTQGKEE